MHINANEAWAWNDRVHMNAKEAWAWKRKGADDCYNPNTEDLNDQEPLGNACAQIPKLPRQKLLGDEPVSLVQLYLGLAGI